MDTVIVSKDTLQKLLDYMREDEARDFEECIGMQWSESELRNHAYALIEELDNAINSQKEANNE